MRILAIGAYCFGFGVTAIEAITNAKKHGSYPTFAADKQKYKGQRVFSLHVVPPSATVNDMGGINYNMNETKPVHVCYADIDGKVVINLDDYPDQLENVLDATENVTSIVTTDEEKADQKYASQILQDG
jgi:hypothetical protein